MDTCYDATGDLGPSLHLEQKEHKYPLHVRGRAILLGGALPWLVAGIAWAILG